MLITFLTFVCCHNTFDQRVFLCFDLLKCRRKVISHIFRTFFFPEIPMIFLLKCPFIGQLQVIETGKLTVRYIDKFVHPKEQIRIQEICVKITWGLLLDD